MKFLQNNNYLVIVLLIFWMLYGAWEYYVIQWAKIEKTPVIRVDLFIIYPILFILSSFIVFKIYKNFKSNNK